MSDIKRVGVLGCGLMGSGIAQVAASAGYDTIVRDISKEFLDRGRAGIEKSLAKFVEKGKLQAADRDATLKRLTQGHPVKHVRPGMLLGWLTAKLAHLVVHYRPQPGLEFPPRRIVFK